MNGALCAAALAAAGTLGIVAFDFLYAVSIGCGAKGIIKHILEFLSAFAACAVVWYGLLKFASGQARLCTVLCAAIGVVLYIMTLRKLVFCGFCVILEKIFDFFHFILKILLTPARFLYKMVYVVLYTKRNRNGDGADAQKD